MKWFTAHRGGRGIHVAPISDTHYVVLARYGLPGADEWMSELTQDWRHHTGATHVRGAFDYKDLDAAKAGAVAWAQTIQQTVEPSVLRALPADANEYERAVVALITGRQSNG